MAKRAPVETLDAQLDYVAGSTALHICSSEPATFAAVGTSSLGTLAMAGGDFTKSGTVPANRVLTIAAKSGVPITSTNAGSTLHLALVNTAGSTLRYVTTIPSQSLTSGNTANTGTWTITLSQPT